MSEQPTTPAGSGQLRTLAVRINEDLRAQLDVVSQLTGRSATEEIRLALEHWIEKTKSDPELLKKAERVRAEIAREAETRAKAIAAIFGKQDSPEKPNEGRTAQRRGSTATN
jgi:predicted DNA-binding protein